MAKEKWLWMILLLCGNYLNAQEKIDTDRPDQTESAFTVPAGWLQFESGFARTGLKGFNEPLVIWTMPTLLTRWGVSKRFELRLLIENERWGNKHRLFRDTVGLIPIELGTKINLWEEKGLLPKTSLIAQTGCNRLSGKNYSHHFDGFFAPGASLVFQNSFSDHSALGYNFGMNWEGGRYDPPVWFYTISPGFDFSDRCYGFIELFGFFERGNSPEHILDGGFAWYINKNTKLDISAGIGITSNAPKNFISAGISVRGKIKKR